MTQKNDAKNNGTFRTSKFLKQTWRRGRGRKQTIKQPLSPTEKISRKRNTQIPHLRDKIREAIAQCHEPKRKLFQSPLQPTQAPLEKKREKRQTHKRARAPGPEQTTSQKRGNKEDSLSSRSNPALYQVLKTRGRS